MWNTYHRAATAECSITGNYFSHQEDNGTQETLITEDHSISNSTLFKDRVKLGTDYGLYLSPVQIHDDDRKFSCHVIVRTGKVLRNSTTIKVFGKSFWFLDPSPFSFKVSCLTFPQRGSTLLAGMQLCKGSYSRVLFTLTLVIHLKGGDEGKK